MKVYRGNGDRRWKNVGVVRERDSRRALQAWGLFLALVLALVPAGFYLLQRNRSVEARLRLNALQESLERSRELERRLAIEWAEVASPERIEAWAERRRDLVRPEPRDVIAVSEDDVATRDLLAGERR